ncbi:MAG: L-threonylcarbamoyladenylate synthase [Gammaproteobacteria bacterium]|jgi:L-threonylcarbamoyladenylate synthase
MSCDSINEWHIARAVRALRAAGIVLHATEGVWGLACDPFDEQAVGRLLRLKNRSVDQGLIVIGASARCFEPELAALGPADRATIAATWPGAVTWIVPNVRFPCWITGGRSTVAVRVPGHGQTRALCRAFGGPLVSTSANRSGQPPAINGLQARCRLAGFPTRQDWVLPGDVVVPGRPSVIRTLAGATLRA